MDVWRQIKNIFIREKIIFTVTPEIAEVLAAATQISKTLGQGLPGTDARRLHVALENWTKAQIQSINPCP